VIRVFGLVAALSAVTLGACEQAEPPPAPPASPARPAAAIARAPAACDRPGTGEQLKRLMFEEAKLIRTANAEMLDRLAEAATARTGPASIKSRDDALDATVCTARLEIELPAGVRDPFNGSSSLAGDVEFAAQGSAASRDVFVIAGGESISYRLAAIELREPTPAPAPAPAAVAVAARVEPLPKASRPRVARVAEAGSLAEPRRSRQGRPGFDCRSARSRVEGMICRDERLAAYDRVLGPLYDRALDRAGRDRRAALRATQARFKAARDRCDGGVCVARVYQARMDEIDAIMVARRNP
jgi:hypothetical protein